MKNYLFILLASLICRFFPAGDAAILPGKFSNYHISNKEIHLKYGKFYPHGKHHLDDDLNNLNDHHGDEVVYRWLGDDIVKTEEEFEGEIDEDYVEKERKIELPGGCQLTEAQFKELESFKENAKYVKKCYCESAVMYCQLNKLFLKRKKSDHDNHL